VTIPVSVFGAIHAPLSAVACVLLRMFVSVVGAILFTVACAVLCLCVASGVSWCMGSNLYFAPAKAWLAGVWWPAMAGGVMHFGCSARRWFKQPATTEPPS
jgi:hypothetical protein